MASSCVLSSHNKFFKIWIAYRNECVLGIDLGPISKGINLYHLGDLGDLSTGQLAVLDEWMEVKEEGELPGKPLCDIWQDRF